MIELRKYNKIGELLIEIGITGLQGHIYHWDGGQRVSVTMAAVCMGVKETGMRTGHRGAYNQPLSQEREQVHSQPLQSNQRSISMQ